ncbi:hypothetical protein MNBD_GAMMA23-1046 [hydrothermal vent metagenome]|uniref:DUF302 domain-containing protein n=1 Tax=hydrothermal vent metagenome TaxID=652676 RepID=A0A3B1A015_9ZZZZ
MIRKNVLYILFLFISMNVFAAPELEAALPEAPTLAATASETSIPATATAIQEQPIASTEQAPIVEPLVFVHKVKGKMNKVYKRLFTALENNGYYVIFEPNIGRNLAHFSKRWGKDYNKNKLDSIRSMVFCNGWYANKISNEDPNMLALCPLHVTLIHKKGYTSVLFVKPGLVSQGSAANSVALELEQDVIRIIRESVR